MDIAQNSKIYARQPSMGERITSNKTWQTYEIGVRIGEGNFGIVYEGTDDWGNELAIKVLKPKGSYDEVRTKAESEFLKLVGFRNPFITFVFDAFEYKNTFYIVTERCAFSLEKLFELKKFNGMTWFKPIARNLLQAVHFLHTNNFAHQDIHVGNIFIAFTKDELLPSEKNEAINFKLGDFGIAKFFHEISAENTLAGWMLPPEILDPYEFGTADHRIDIYHIGLLFLQLALSSRIEFTYDEILNGEPRKIAESLKSAHGDLIAKMLRRHVEHRAASVLEVWNELKIIEL